MRDTARICECVHIKVYAAPGIVYRFGYVLGLTKLRKSFIFLPTIKLGKVRVGGNRPAFTRKKRRKYHTHRTLSLLRDLGGFSPTKRKNVRDLCVCLHHIRGCTYSCVCVCDDQIARKSI